MADKWYRLVATLPKESGFPEDAVQNTIHVVDIDDDGNLTAAMEAFRDFYIVDTAGAGTAVCDLLSTAMERAANACTITAYEVPQIEGPVGAPVDQITFGLQAAPVTTPLPDELAICLSFHSGLAGIPESVPGGAPGPAGDTRPRARLRGRIYLGALSTAVTTAAPSDTVEPVVGTGARTIITAAAVAMSGDIDAADMGWHVFSRTDWAMNAVEGGWVDNAFDIQRRRGIAPTVRTTFTV